MSHQVNDEWADRAADLLPYLTTGEAMDLTGAYEALGDFESVVLALEAKYAKEMENVRSRALKHVKTIQDGITSDLWPEEWAANYQKPEGYER
jgi:hypothetical protein